MLNSTVQGVAVLLFCGALLLALSLRKATECYHIVDGVCFGHRRTLVVSQGLGIGLILGLPVWPIAGALFGILEDLEGLVRLIITVVLTPWVIVIWNSLSNSQDSRDVRAKLSKLKSAAAAAGIALTILVMSLIPS